MVYVLTAQFRAKCKTQSEQEVEQGTWLPIEPVINQDEETAYSPSIEGIWVLGQEGPNNMVALMWPPTNMLTHVRPLHIKPLFDGVPMNSLGGQRSGYQHSPCCHNEEAGQGEPRFGTN